jgi:tetratricopeptide (TPR) repeat protein/DNA-binding CsgD family transcriptional regulator
MDGTGLTTDALTDRPARTLCPLAMRVRGSSHGLVGRPIEMAAIRQELETAAGGRLTCVSVEGEPGIGKTRLLSAAQELAETMGYVPIAIAADEELGGPFLLARSIFGCRAVQELAATTPAASSVERALAALSGRDDPTLSGLAGDERLLRVYDLAAIAVNELAAARPLAILLDDLHWSDVDSLRLLRYVVRSDADSRILLLIALRPEETATVTELVTLVADMERLGFLRRLRLHRLTSAETIELLRLILGGEVDPLSGATVHGQAEGVPFIVEELGKAYREANVIRPVGGVWTLARNAARLVPSAVQTLIDRRAARLPKATLSLLADAGVLGRSFSLRDLRAVVDHVDAAAADIVDPAEVLAPAVAAGLLVQYPDGSAADYGFTHEHVRDLVVASLPAPRRRKIHAAIVDLLAGSGEPASESLPLLAHHARAAGNAELSARYAIEAARAALARNAPAEVLRSVEIGLPVVTEPRDRVELLLLRDDALGMLHRPAERLEALAEVSALADALREPALSLQLLLRRAAALRDAGDHDTAADVAREVRRRAEAMGDPRLELAADLELGQALLRSPLGEGYVPVISEIDADGAQEAFESALRVARTLGDDRGVAAASRELGVVAMARVRAVVIDMVVSGEVPQDMLQHRPLMGPYMEALGAFQQAIEAYDRLGDRRGVMSSILGLAYATWGADFRFVGAIRRLEDLRRLAGRMATLATESEQNLAELQLLYGIHVYAREFGGADLALGRGEDAYRKARAYGERTVEFLAAGGMALALLQVGGNDEAATWLERAGEAAAASPTPLKSRRLELWRGQWAAASGDSQRARQHLGRAVELAIEQGTPAARCEALARLAIEVARLGDRSGDPGLLEEAEGAAQEAIELSRSLPGHPPWRAQAQAALAAVRSARHEPEAALDSARAALAEIEASEQDELQLGIWLPCVRAVLAAGDEAQKSRVLGKLALLLGRVAEQTMDEGLGRHWFATMPQSELVALIGGVEAARLAFRSSPIVAAYASLPSATVDLSPEEGRLLRLMTEARTDGELAATLGVTEEQLARQLAGVMARLNAPSRAAATAFALLQRAV